MDRRNFIAAIGAGMAGAIPGAVAVIPGHTPTVTHHDGQALTPSVAADGTRRKNLPEEDRLLRLLLETKEAIEDVQAAHDEAEPGGDACDCSVCTDLAGLHWAVETGHDCISSVLLSPSFPFLSVDPPKLEDMDIDIAVAVAWRTFPTVPRALLARAEMNMVQIRKEKQRVEVVWRKDAPDVIHWQIQEGLKVHGEMLACGDDFFWNEAPTSQAAWEKNYGSDWTGKVQPTCPHCADLLRAAYGLTRKK
jgi:hypothetical protein